VVEVVTEGGNVKGGAHGKARGRATQANLGGKARRTAERQRGETADFSIGEKTPTEKIQGKKIGVRGQW